MQLHFLRLIAPLLLLLAMASAADDFLGDMKKSLSGMDLKMSGSGASIGVKTDDSNPMYYKECSAGISIDTGFDAGCVRKWKPLFYACVVGGGVLAALLVSCCCCCCCAPCRRKRAAATTYIPVVTQSSVVVNHPAAAYAPMQQPQQPQQPPKYDVQMLQA